MSDVTVLWDRGVDVTEKTDTDLDAARRAQMHVTNNDGEMVRFVETLRQAEASPSRSCTCDRSLRIELAHAIDTYTVDFGRAEYDIAYMIPPVGWVAAMPVYDDVELVPPDDVDVDVDTPSISFATTPQVAAMAERAANSDAYESQTAIAATGIRRRLGRLSS